MKYLSVNLFFFAIYVGFCNFAFAKEYSYSDFSIDIPESWQAVELDKDGISRSWLFGKQATENESGVSVAVHVSELSGPEFSSEEDLQMTKDRWLNQDVYTMGKSKQVLNTSIIYDETIDGESFRAVNFRSLLNVYNRPDLNLEIYGRVYLTIMGSKVITVNFQASNAQEDVTKPELEKIVESIQFATQ
ncbi:MAG: hypothetical protein AB8B92_06010 [Gammaproteobacteria bacterium]